MISVSMDLTLSAITLTVKTRKCSSVIISVIFHLIIDFKPPAVLTTWSNSCNREQFTYRSLKITNQLQLLELMEWKIRISCLASTKSLHATGASAPKMRESQEGMYFVVKVTLNSWLTVALKEPHMLTRYSTGGNGRDAGKQIVHSFSNLCFPI